MANWLERARREIPQSADRPTAKTAERNPTAVMAVPEPGEPEISGVSIGSNGTAPAAGFQKVRPVVPLTAGEERSLRAWLAQINETDEAIIAHILNQCRIDADARGYFLRWAAEVLPDVPDDRRHCDQCANLTPRGRCLAAWRGEIVAARGYQPVRDVPRRCEGYAPRADDADRRPGRERWPGLGQRGSDDANT